MTPETEYRRSVWSSLSYGRAGVRATFAGWSWRGMIGCCPGIRP
jgi:hypothetical protein